MVKVAADVTPLLTPRTGIGVFVGEMLGHLAARDDLDLTGYAVSWRGRDRLAEAVPEGMAVAQRPMAARPLHQVWMRSDHPRIDRWIGRHDVVWGTNYVVPPTGAAAIVSIYDLTPVRFPELANAHTRTFPGLIRRALRRGASVHTMSSYVRDEIVDQFDVAAERVHVVPGGVRATPAGDKANDPASATTVGRTDAASHGRTGYGPTVGGLIGDDPYILALGTVEPRKDLPTLVAAFDLLAESDTDLRLVIAGADGWGAEALTEAIEKAKFADRIVRVGWVDEADRPALLRNATVYAYPSLYEGFGFPPLEAMSVGVPVVATRTGSLPEVCGDGAVLVPPRETEALADAIRRVSDDGSHRAELIRRGHENAARYSWDSAATQLASLLMSLT